MGRLPNRRWPLNPGWPGCMGGGAIRGLGDVGCPMEGDSTTGVLSTMVRSVLPVATYQPMKAAVPSRHKNTTNTLRAREMRRDEPGCRESVMDRASLLIGLPRRVAAH